MSLSNVGTSHDLGCILGGSIESASDFLEGCIEEEGLMLPVVPSFGNQKGGLGLGLSFRVGYCVAFIET